MTRTPPVLAALFLANAALAAPIVVHSPVTETTAGQPVRVSGTVSTGKAIRRIVIKYRAAGGGPFTESAQSGDLRSFDIEIPGAVVNAAGLEYFIEVTGDDGVTKLPPGPTGVFTVRVNEPEPVAPAATAPAGAFTLAVASPEPGEAVDDPQPAFYVTADSAAGLDPRSVKVTLDGRDVTAQARVTADSVSFTPAKALGLGTHTLSVEAKDLAGASGTPAQAEFTVTTVAGAAAEDMEAARAKAVSGYVSVESQLPAYLEAPADKRLVSHPQYTRATASVRAVTGPLTTQISAFVTDEDLRRTDAQPMSRARIDLSLSDQIMLTGGDFSPVMTELTAWNPPRVRGGQLAIQTRGAGGSRVKLTVFGGQSQFALEGSIIGYDALGHPFIAGGNLSQSMFGSRAELDWFKGLTTGLNFVDVRDWGGSVKLKPGYLQPQLNQVLSTDGRLRMGPVLAEGELAGSLYSRDQSILSIANMGGMAWRAKGGMDWQGHRLLYGFRTTGMPIPVLGMKNFQNLANPSFQPDYRGQQLEGSTHALNHLIMVNGTWESWRDNLQGVKVDTAGNPNTTTSRMWTTDLRLAPRWVTFGLNLSGQTQADASPLAQHTDNSVMNVGVNLTANRVKLFGEVYGLATLGVISSSFRDHAPAPFSPNLTTSGESLAVIVDVNPRLQVSAGGGLTTAKSAALTDGFGNTSPAFAATFTTLNGRATYAFIPAVLTAFAGFDTVSSSNDVPTTGNAAIDAANGLDTGRLGVHAGATWKPSRAQSLTGELQMVDSADGLDALRTTANQPTRSYQELVVNLRYAYEF